MAAAIDRDTGLTLIASADGTTSVVDRGVSSKFGTVSHLAERRACRSATRPRPTGPSSCGTVRCRRDAAVVTLRAVDESGQLGRQRRQDARAFRASRARPRSAATTLAVADSSGVVRRYDGSRQTAVLDVEVVGDRSDRSLVALRHDRLGLVIGSTSSRSSTRATESSARRTSSTVLTGARFSAVAAFPEGGRLAASMSDGSLRIFDVETGKEVARTMTNARSSGLAISPDEQADRAGRRAHRCGLDPRHDDAATRRAAIWSRPASSTT